ncbi:MAG: hypothetical protein QM737_22540 [Ferruginibacter sp.]
MKKNILYLAIATITTGSIIISCKKDDAPSPGGYTGPVIRKWNIARHIDTTFYFNGPAVYLDYQPAIHGDYLEFTPDGKLYRLEDGVMDTATFTLSNDTLIVQREFLPHTTTFKIEVSTTDSLQLNGVSYMVVGSHDVERTHYYLNSW